jgi:2'-5' RNA ligase
MSPDTLRLFVAIRPGADAVARLRPDVDDVMAALSPEAAAALHPLGDETWHVTLQYLGAVDVADVDRVRLACAFAAGRIRPFALSYTGLGAFSSARRARFLWAGVGDGADEVAALATAVQAQTAKLGFEPSGRDYVPHLTIARGTDRADVEALLAHHTVGPVDDRVGEIVLYRSNGAPAASLRYDPVDTFPLQT